MRLAVLSDLHIGVQPSPGGFIRSEKWLLQRLEQLESTHDAILFVGDLFETHGHPIWGLRKAQVRRLDRHFPRFMRAIKSGRYTVLFGNHDRVLAHTHNIREASCIESDGLRILFVHGHQVDPAYKRFPGLEYTAHWFGIWLGRVRLTPLLRGLHSLEKHLNRFLFPPGESVYRRWPRVLLRGGAADLVITGHRHRWDITSTEYGTFANSGSCVDEKFEALSIDTKLRNIKHITYCSALNHFIEGPPSSMKNNPQRYIPEN